MKLVRNTIKNGFAPVEFCMSGRVVMPTYDYECRSCGEVFEKFHSMTSRPRVKCPECGGGSKKMLGAGAGIIFKGSGFYETDYRRKNMSKPEDKSSASDAKQSSDASGTNGGSKDSSSASDKSSGSKKGLMGDSGARGK